MTTRERWIVYPLLFLTLGIALRDKVLPASAVLAKRIYCTELQAGKAQCGAVTGREIGCMRLKSGRVQCGLLSVTESDGKDRIRMGVTAERTGRLALCSQDGSVVVAAGVDPESQSGAVETFTTGGVPQVRLHSTASGGAVTAVDDEEEVLVTLGHYESEFGVFLEVPGLSRPVPLTLPLFQGTSPESAQPPTDQSP